MGAARELYEHGWAADEDGGEQPFRYVGDELMASIRSHEGFRGMPYRDSLDKLTVGIGTLLPLTEDEAMLVAACRAEDGCRELEGALERHHDIGLHRLPRDVSRALEEMAFQLGVSGLMGFRKMLTAIGEERWADAANEALDSRWARQTPVRAEHVAGVLRAQV